MDVVDSEQADFYCFFYCPIKSTLKISSYGSVSCFAYLHIRSIRDHPKKRQKVI